MSEHRVLFVGLGSLGSQIFDLLVRVPGRFSFLVGGRNLEYLQQRTNLSSFAAAQLGFSPKVSCISMDLWKREQTAEVILHFQPDIIFCAATLQRTEALSNLPRSVSEQLATAQLGPQLPLHLTLISNLMQAIQMTGLTITVLNAIYPDVVGPVLHQVGLAPTTGIGDLANNVPALRRSLARSLKKPEEQVDLRQIMARYVSYWITRAAIDDAPSSLTALVDGDELPYSLDLRTVFHPLRTSLKRSGGIAGLLMTATSACVVFDGIVNNTGVITHAPGPNGLPGGYPVKIDAQGVEVVLPSHISLSSALQINEAGLHLDGIQKIEHDGTVHFTEQNMAVFKKLLGYECKQMRLSEVGDWARELQAKYTAFVNQYS